MTAHTPPFTTGCFDDIAAQAEQLAGYDQLYVQLERGRFAGTFSNYGFANGVEFATERVNRVIHQRAAVPRGTLTLGYLAHSAGDYRVNGQTMAAGDIFLFPAGAEIEVTTAHSDIVVVSIPQHALPDPIGGARQYRPRIFSAKEPAVGPMGAMIGRANRRVLANPGLAADAAVGDGVMADLTLGLHTMIGATAPPEAHNGLYTARLATFRRISRRFNAAPGDFSLNAACAQLGISRRTAELSFRVVVGISPSRYFQLCRLNLLRGALRDMPGRPRAIGDTATALGINHLGRLSADYAQMFGVKPSQDHPGHG